MSSQSWLFTVLVATGLLGAIGFHVGAQPPMPNTPQGTLLIQGADGTVFEQTLDGKLVRTIAGRMPQALTVVPRTTATGQTVYAIADRSASDPDAVQMIQQEQSVAQEARALAAQYGQADSDGARTEAKTKLREKLVAIFDLQQKRRAAEIGKIEERLDKLKETMKKRDASKDPIVDRRLGQLTGGVDELGWEESGGLPVNAGMPNLYGALPVPPPPMAGVRLTPAATPPLAPAAELPTTAVAPNRQ